MMILTLAGISPGSFIRSRARPHDCHPKSGQNTLHPLKWQVESVVLPPNASNHKSVVDKEYGINDRDRPRSRYHVSWTSLDV